MPDDLENRAKKGFRRFPLINVLHSYLIFTLSFEVICSVAVFFEDILTNGVGRFLNKSIVFSFVKALHGRLYIRIYILVNDDFRNNMNVSSVML